MFDNCKKMFYSSSHGSANGGVNNQNRREKMHKLLEQFKADPSEKNRVKLLNYLNKHMMAICVASPDDQKFIKTHIFKV